jgi:predicted metal-dependent phosphoesterase TrpH
MSTNPNFIVDLHAHTTRSDGNDSPAELLEHAAARGLKAVAITDHDVLPPDEIVAKERAWSVADYAASLGLSVLRGIEVSCDTHVDDVHIVGFGCDWKSPAIRWLPELAVTSKTQSYRVLVGRLRAAGMDVSWEEVLDGGRRREDDVQKKHIFELLARKGHAPTWQAAKIMVRDNPDYDVKREKPDPIKTVRSLHEAGGIAILAHPYLIDETVTMDGAPVSRDAYIRRLIAAGLDGIETRYTYDKTSDKGRQTPEEIRAEVEARYGAAVAILSGGSDYHADHKKGVANARQLGDAGVPLDYFRRCAALLRCCEGKTLDRS